MSVFYDIAKVKKSDRITIATEDGLFQLTDVVVDIASVDNCGFYVIDFDTAGSYDVSSGKTWVSDNIYIMKGKTRPRHAGKYDNDKDRTGAFFSHHAGRHARTV